MASGRPVLTRKAPIWALLLVIAVPALGIAAIVRGDIAMGVVFLAAIPVVYVVARIVKHRAAEHPGLDEPSAMARTLRNWAVGLGSLGAFFVYIGVLGIIQGVPIGIPTLLVGLVGLLLAGRNLQAMVTVRRFPELADRHGLRPLVILVGREAGAGGFFRGLIVIGLDKEQAAIARASIRRVGWDVKRLAELSATDIRIKGATGDFATSSGTAQLHVTAIPAGSLTRARDMLPSAKL